MSGTGAVKNEILKDFPQLELNEEEAKIFVAKLKLKGKQRYKELYNAVLAENNNQKFSYEVLSQHYRYDIKLRRALYKIISFTEVAMRATIANKYGTEKISKRNIREDFKEIIGKEIYFDPCERKKISIAFNSKKKMTLFEFLENVDMQILNRLFSILDKETIESIFTYDGHIECNLDSMRKLRNAVMHNNILITKKYGKVWINEQEKQDLQSHVENAINLSPEMVKDNLKRLINNCLIIDEEHEEEYKKQGKEADNRYKLSEKYKVYFEGVQNGEEK